MLNYTTNSLITIVLLIIIKLNLIDFTSTNLSRYYLKIRQIKGRVIFSTEILIYLKQSTGSDRVGYVEQIYLRNVKLVRLSTSLSLLETESNTPVVSLLHVSGKP